MANGVGDAGGAAGSDPNAIHWALYNACADNNIPGIARAISAGADPTFSDFFKWSCLHWVSSNGNAEAFFLVLPATSNLDCRDKYQKTPADSAKGPMKTIFAIGAGWGPSDPRWHLICQSVDYKQKSSRKWSTGRIAVLDSTSLNIYVSGKTTPAVQIQLSAVVTASIDCGQSVITFLQKSSSHSYSVRFGANDLARWASELRDKHNMELKGEGGAFALLVNPSKKPSDTTGGNGVPYDVLRKRLEETKDASKEITPSGSHRASIVPETALATTLAALEEDPAVHNNVVESPSTPTKKPNDVIQSTDTDLVDTATVNQTQPQDGLENDKKLAQMLATRVTQLEEENRTLTRLFEAQEKKIEQQQIELAAWNEELRDQIAEQTRAFADQTIKIIDMSEKLAITASENEKLQKTLSTLTGSDAS